MKRIRDLRFLTNNTYVVRFDREDMQFRAGQHISAGPRDSAQLREYSIYSGEQDGHLEILVREVTDGNISVRLKECQPGQLARIRGPRGRLVLGQEEISGRTHVFIATGTGIAPFHSYVRSYPGLDYRIIHGVRHAGEAYDRDHYDAGRYILCTSKDSRGDYQGRVTGYLKEQPADPEALYHVVGNSQMVYEVYDILREKGVDASAMRSEVYF
ncbi:MAG: FAD-binding oxidoreductase [Bacteroidales bacterium]